jgi:hypothetical protein
MLKHLNHIYTGVPGSGKTFTAKKEALKIINEGSSQDEMTFNQKFKRIMSFVRTNYSEQIYNTCAGKNVYRNTNAIPYFLSLSWCFGRKDGSELDPDLLINNSSLRLAGPSTWSQYIRYFTEFGFCEGSWADDFSGNTRKKIIFNAKGIELSNEFNKQLSAIGKSPIDVLNISDRSILNTEDGLLPEFIRIAYLDSISLFTKNTDSLTSFKKTIMICLEMAMDEELYKQKGGEQRNATEEEKNKAKQYFDFKPKMSDFSWLGWYATILTQLGLVEIKSEDEFKVYFKLTEYGLSFVKQLIDDWATLYPSHLNKELPTLGAMELGQLSVVSVHQSLSYEEFVEGIRPNLGKQDSQNNFELCDGIFKSLCKRAAANHNDNYVIILDEINRGNISSIFGELISLIEPTKRSGEADELSVTLSYSRSLFSVPPNVYIFGTMNEIDKSVSDFDFALRRRFSFQELKPDYELLDGKFIGTINLKNILKKLNERIRDKLGKNYEIGHSYFLKICDEGIDSLLTLFINELIPLISSYTNDDNELLNELLTGDPMTPLFDDSNPLRLSSNSKEDIFKNF